MTGSRIPQPNLTSVSPVTAVGLGSVKIEGVTRVEDLINNLRRRSPTSAATCRTARQAQQPSICVTSARNARWSGEQPRLMPAIRRKRRGLGRLNQIPRRDRARGRVLTGGASAVYGADAVAGVVNFIMNDKFEGVRHRCAVQQYQHNNEDDVIQD